MRVFVLFMSCGEVQNLLARHATVAPVSPLQQGRVACGVLLLVDHGLWPRFCAMQSCVLEPPGG